MIVDTYRNEGKPSTFPKFGNISGDSSYCRDVDMERPFVIFISAVSERIANPLFDISHTLQGFTRPWRWILP